MNNEDNFFTNFGFKKIKINEKVKLVKEVFDSVANHYDLMNDLMSLGSHRLWKNYFINLINPQADDVIGDIGGGTGDISIGLAKKCSKIYCIDINENMLSIGKSKALDHGYTSSINFIQGDAQELPLEDSFLTKYAISFCIRNVTDINKALQESYRVLKPNGKFFCLEFSHVQNELLSSLYEFWSFHIIPQIGKYVANNQDAYQYLVESIKKFPPQDEFKAMIENAGFKNVKYKNILNGIATIHYGEK